MAQTTPAPKRPSFTGGPRQNAPLNYVSLADREEILADQQRVRRATKGQEMAALIAEAKAFRKTWGKFTRDGWRFDSVVGYGAYISEADEIHLCIAMTKTKADAAARAAQAMAAPYIPIDGDNELSDAQVAAGIRWLRIDGLNAYDKSLGHLCYGLLDVDYAGAIAVARGIIGKYSKTLYKAGVL